MSTPEICTTYVATRRHLSRNLEATMPLVPGRMGETLCREGAYDAERLAWHCAARNEVPPDLDAMPCCRNCERDRVRLNLDAPDGWVGYPYEARRKAQR